MDKVLQFELNTQSFGIDLNYVKEVLENENIKPVPLAPPFVSGIVNRRGKFLTIIDLARLLGQPQEELPKDSRIIVLDHKEMDIALLVSKVTGTKSLALNNQEEKPNKQTDDDKKGFLQLVLKRGENKVSVFDLERLFSFLKEGKF